MATAPYQTLSKPQNNALVERWFFTGMALAMIAISLIAFLPSITHPAERRAPLSALAAAHAVVFFAWLLLFLVQSRLIATHRVAIHRRLGLASIVILALMIPLAYTTTIAMVRRGYDLSGDLSVGINNELAHQTVFPLANLLIFSALAIAAVAFRRRPEIHRRLMLFANIELMPAPLAHLIGHTPWLASLPPVIVMVPSRLLRQPRSGEMYWWLGEFTRSPGALRFSGWFRGFLRRVQLVRARPGTTLFTGWLDRIHG
jgi:hypothetical protein